MEQKMITRITPISLLLLLVVLSSTVYAQTRTEVAFPDINGYKTIAADLHTHTVFSDGTVWPTVRVGEAWRNGLDVLSITDHLEYLPHKDDVLPKFNRPYEIAKPEADKMGIMLIRGAEITRDEPHGHFNAVFLSDCEPLNTPDQKDAVKAAHEQGAFIWWNHPEWKRDDGKAWCEIQQEYLDLGWMHGLEVFNGGSYYVNAHQWALDHNLTLLGNTDIHAPIDEIYNYAEGEHRTMTLVFVKENTPEGLKEALFERRTVVFSSGMLVGREEWLRPLTEASVKMETSDITLRGKSPVVVSVFNACAAPLDLELADRPSGIAFPKSLLLPSGKSAHMRVQGGGNAPAGTETVEVSYAVKNALLAPNTPLTIKLVFNVTFAQ